MAENKWAGWLAALSGLLVFGYYVPSMASWAVPTGALGAVVFGIWAIYQ